MNKIDIFGLIFTLSWMITAVIFAIWLWKRRNDDEVEKMTLSEWIKKYGDREIEYDGSNLKIKEPESKRWQPHVEGFYYYVNAYGNVVREWNMSGNLKKLKKLFRVGNVFRTEEEAQRAADTLRLMAKLQDYGASLNWNPGITKYSLYADGNQAFKMGIFETTDGIIPVYFDNQSDAKRAIKDIGERDLWKFMKGKQTHD